MKITLEVFPAKNGDSFLLSIDDTNFLIDSGYVDTFKSYIKPRIKKLNEKGQSLERLIITHIDEDHIAGGIKLLEENGNNSSNNLIPINQIWHNSYRHLNQVKSKKEISSEALRILRSLNKKNNKGEKSNQKKISAKQGSSFAGLILEGEYNWNTDFSGTAINDISGEIQISEKIRIKIISPNEVSLNKLEKFWKRELKKLGFKWDFNQDKVFDDAFEFLLLHEKSKVLKNKNQKISSGKVTIDKLLKNEFQEDSSPTNGSSIAFILEIEERKLLFLGDAHPSVIESGIARYYPNQTLPVFFDLIKVSHHGSFANNSPNLLKKIESNRYVISTNGIGHSHPDIETLAWIISQKKGEKKSLFFNYKNEGFNFLDNPEFKKEFNYEIYLPDNNASLIITI